MSQAINNPINERKALSERMHGVVMDELRKDIPIDSSRANAPNEGMTFCPSR